MRIMVTMVSMIMSEFDGNDFEKMMAMMRDLSCRLDYREFCTMIHSRKSEK